MEIKKFVDNLFGGGEGYTLGVSKGKVCAR